jgi:radical SAM enzyme (TIGR01210 family)
LSAPPPPAAPSGLGSRPPSRSGGRFASDRRGAEGSTRTAPLHAAQVRALRPPRPTVDPWTPLGTTEEDERQPDGSIAPAATLFLAGAECPWACVFCDLWRYTIEGATPLGAIPRQIELALASLHREPAVVKLYNASNFFDPRAVPPADDDAIATLVRHVSRVVVECHPRLVGERAAAFARRLDGTLEIGLGLETIDPRAAPHLGKEAALEDFERATDFLHGAGIDVRVFLLVGVPWVPRAQQVASAANAAHYARERLGARHISLIPVRGGNGALERLAADGSFAPPDLALLEQALDACLAATPGGVVPADLGDLERLAVCPRCFAARRDRLDLVNRTGSARPAIDCSACGS